MIPFGWNGSQYIRQYYLQWLYESLLMPLHVSVRLEAVQQLSVETVSEGSVRLRWRSVSDAQAYRLVWGPFTGQNKGNIKQHLLFLIAFLLLQICIHFCFSFQQGRNVETVEVAGGSEFYTLSRLQPDTEYIVTIIPLYERNIEGPIATARFKIGKCAICYKKFIARMLWHKINLWMKHCKKLQVINLKIWDTLLENGKVLN